ncbi:MAG: hypothetical protein CVU77_06465 [Elusimicrobia bacterium HGW-Elusimicrobia-1]|nr:MAG: hypothetical protein CVU77_06465 [Elusimicrobia bacterium HGW-Elusimicrobia-1]
MGSTRYHTSQSAEFFVYSQLHRLELNAVITLGNAKAVDILVYTQSKETLKFDVKGLKVNNYFLGLNDSICDKCFFYCFVILGKDPTVMPIVGIVPSDKLKLICNYWKSKNTKKDYSVPSKTISYLLAKEYEKAADYIMNVVKSDQGFKENKVLYDHIKNKVIVKDLALKYNSVNET